MSYFILMIILFVLGYAFIALEHPLKINKSASALLLAVVLWSVFALFGDGFEHSEIISHLGETAEIVFFLLGAMTIVEIIDSRCHRLLAHANACGGGGATNCHATG